MSFKFNSRRSPMLARHGMVATSQPLAAITGLQILMQGGNAADAAVATAAALNVTEPISTGIGGDCFALFYKAQTRTITALNGSGRAPGALSLELLARQGFRDALPPFHAHTVTVPGACAGWFDLVDRHGTLPMTRILAPAIHLADEGFPVAPATAHYWTTSETKLKSASGGQALLIDGHAPQAGQIFRNPGLARTFRAIAEGGKDAYYRGEIASAIAAVVQQAGGVMTTQDLAQHTSTWDTPISTDYRGVRVWECPPNGQGLAALIALNLLEGFDLGAMDPMSVERWHTLVEALRLAFSDTGWYVADPQFASIPLEGLLSKTYADERRRLVRPDRATTDMRHGTLMPGSDTVYLAVVDGEGNACSFINSNYSGVGTGLVPEGWGFTLQNRGQGFSLNPAHPNALAPNKRPYHTIIPGMLTLEADGSLYAPFGVMGGFMQPQGHVQVVVGMIDDGLDPQAALDRPRFHLDPPTASGRVKLEEGLAPELAAALQARGHTIEAGIGGYARATFGRGQIIRRDPDGVLWGGSDPRIDGCAVGY